MLFVKSVLVTLLLFMTYLTYYYSTTLAAPGPYRFSFFPSFTSLF